MSDEAEVSPPAAEKTPKYTTERKRRVNFNIAQAILAIHERKKLSYYCDYKAVADRYNVNRDGLRSVYAQWCAGTVDLGIIDEVASKTVDMRAQHAKTLDLVNRHTAILLIRYESAIYHAEDQMGKINARQKEDKSLKLPKNNDPTHAELSVLRRELEAVLRLRNNAEEGYNSYLEEINRPPPPEKPINPAHPATMDVQTHVITATDEQRAIQALTRTAEPPEPGPVEPANE